jgi:hypothetical protein
MRFPNPCTSQVRSLPQSLCPLQAPAVIFIGHTNARAELIAPPNFGAAGSTFRASTASFFLRFLRRPLALFRHRFADDDGVTGLGIDAGSDRHAAASNRVGILVLCDNAMLNHLSRGWRHLTADRRRGRRRRRSRLRRRDRLLPGRTAQKQNPKQNEDDPEFPHRMRIAKHSPNITLPEYWKL